MFEKYYFEKPSHTDLNIYRCGTEKCSPGYLWGPGVRDHFIVHCIFSGKGVYITENKSYCLGAGDGFLITPGTIISYQADFENPWSYSWVGFHGIKAGHYLEKAGITKSNPVFRHDRDDSLKRCLAEMITTANHARNNAGEIMLLSLLYRFISILVDWFSSDESAPTANTAEEYVRKAVEYTAKNYSSPLTVQGIADYVGLDRSYLYTLFKRFLNISPQHFILKFRAERACELLMNPRLSVADVARSVGYTDPLQFSKAFKKIMGCPPTQYRKGKAETW